MNLAVVHMVLIIIYEALMYIHATFEFPPFSTDEFFNGNLLETDHLTSRGGGYGFFSKKIF
jgi:hypothetical protein